MKYLFKIILSVGIIAGLLTACNKIGSLPYYSSGTAPVLMASATTIAPAIADSDKTVLTLNWSNPNYATDSSTEKYIIEIDSSGRSFAKEYTTVVSGALSTSFTAKQLNNILLGFGFAYNSAYPIDIRITSSYANNNQQLQSNIVVVHFTTYVVPPKVTPPYNHQLFLIGDATAGAWGNPVPTPAQQFTELDSVTYQGTFFMVGGKSYLLLPVNNGNWDNKYAIADYTVPASGGSFGYNGNDNTYNTNFNGPATTGMYKITVDFQHGTFTVVPVGSYGILYVPGDYQGWTLSTSTPILGSPNNDGNYDGYINVPSGGTYEFKLASSTDWSSALGDGGSGTLSSSGGNLTFPTSGYYHVVANTTNNTWAVYPITTWGIIGSFAASGWGTDIPMTYDVSSNTWTATITTVAGDQFKFRANGSWDGTNQNPNYGDTGADGQLDMGGDNISISAGTHTITLFLGNGGYYTYMIQ